MERREDWQRREQTDGPADLELELELEIEKEQTSETGERSEPRSSHLDRCQKDRQYWDNNDHDYYCKLNTTISLQDTPASIRIVGPLIHHNLASRIVA